MDLSGPVLRRPAFNPALLILIAAAALGTLWLIIKQQDLPVISSFYLVITQLYLGYFLLANNPRSPINVSFGCFSFSLAIWNLFSILVIHVPPAAPLFWADWYIFIPAALMIYFLFYFTMVFPKRQEFFRPWAQALSVLPALLLIGLVLAAPESIISKMVIAKGVRSPVFGPGYDLFGIYGLGYILIGAVSLWHSYRRAKGSERAQMFYFLIGALFSVTGFMLTNLIIPWTLTSALEWMGAWFSLCFIAFTAYAITKHQLMDISVVISRTVAELMAIFLHGALYLLLVGLYRAVTGAVIEPLFLIFTVLYGVIVGQTHQPIRLFLQTTSEKLFLRGKYDYYTALSAASSRVVEKLSLPDILRVLYETFGDVMEISRPRIMLPEAFAEPEKESGGYVVFDRQGSRSRAESERIGLEDPLVPQLIARRAPLLDPHHPEHALIVPCLLEERLIALFVFGPKLSEDPYTEEDLRLLQALSSQAAVALDHTHSYAKIKADLEEAERHLERSQRLASLGTLTAGVTHEIRNPLTVIRGETERLANEARDLAYLQQFRSLILKHIDRIAGIVERMLGLAKEKPRHEIPVDLNELIGATVPLFTAEQVAIGTELGNIPLVPGDPTALQEVIVNLIQNAIEAMPGGGQLKLRTLAEDHRVILEVSDTGKGIPEEIREKIFDPFYSTRHEGVGLGLSIVYRIVREHGGDIKVSSEVGKGTTFRISLSAS